MAVIIIIIIIIITVALGLEFLNSPDYITIFSWTFLLFLS